MERIGIESLTGLIAFARTASLGSYTAAARSLSVSPSAVSKSVQRLEERLKLKLFSRTTRSLTLTPEGRDLHDRALRLMREVEDIEQAAVAARAEPAGMLRITAPLPVGVHLIAPALPRFRELYPKITVDLRIGDRLVDIVEEGVDVAIRVGDLADSRLISRRLAPNRVCAFASPAYIARKGIPQHPDDLTQHECVNFRFQSSGLSLRWPFLVGERTMEVTPDAGIIIDVSDAVLAVLAAGGGIGVSATYVAAPYVKRGELIPVLSEFAVDRFALTALWPESRRSNPNVKAFLAYLHKIFPTPAPWDAIIEQEAEKRTKP